MPLQVSDSITLLLDAVLSPSIRHEFLSRLGDSNYFRPVYYSTIKLVADLGGGEHFLAFRLFHALLIFLFVLLFVRALGVHDRLTLALVPFALTVFVGIHTFLGTVKEIWPISHFLQVAVLCLAALNLTQTRGGLLIDLAMLVVLFLAALTLESGLIVWVIVIAAWLTGMPGASRRTVLATTALVAVYAWLRFGPYDVGVPDINERTTGYLFGRLDPADVAARFGDNLYPFYAYNVVSSIVSVLLSEPRSGEWVTVRALLTGQAQAREWIHLGSSLLATGLIAAYVVDRVRSGVRWPRTLADRHVVIFGAVLVANATISFVYVKDEIISVAGAFYALPVFGAAVHFLRRWQERPRPWALTAVCCVVCLAGSTAWAVRAAGVHYVMRLQAFEHRTDWTRIERRWRQDGNWKQYETSIPLIRELREEVVAMPVPNPHFAPRWMERVFDRYY